MRPFRCRDGDLISVGWPDKIGNLSSPRPSSAAETAPPTLPEWKLLHRIGSGAYGEVWLGRNLATGARRAVKIVYRATFTDERPFNREFEGIKKFEAISHSHPSQLALFHVGKNDSEGYFYYVMELADALQNVGDDVRSLTSNLPEKLEPPHVSSYKAHTLRADLENGRLPAARVLEIAMALTEALAHLHANGLIHRDVKPSNIIFVGGRPKLADIGLVTDASDTRSIVGTEGYLAPEGPGAPAADIYALGKVLYEALTGLDRRRFPELPEDLRCWIESKQVIELNEIVLKACAKEPSNRYQSAEAILADLRLLQGGKSVQKRRVLKRSWSLLWKAAALLAIFSLAAFVINNERQRRSTLAEQNKPEWIKARTTNPAAWQAWKRASQMGSTYTTTGLSNAIAEWERSTQLDPNFVDCWSTLSVTITIAVTEGHLPGTNYLPRAKKYAEKAIELMPQRGWSYTSLGQASISSDYDFGRAEPNFRKAIELEPENWIARNNFAWELIYEIYEGHLDEAERLWKRMSQEQPELPNSYFGLGIIHYLHGNFTNAFALFDEGIRFGPDRPLWHSIRADYFWAANEKLVAARAWLRQVELGGFYFLNLEENSIALTQVLKKEGPDAFLAAFTALLEARRQAGAFVSGFDLARLYSHAGKKSEALDNLEVAVRELRGMNRSVNINPAFSILKKEPRFHAVLATLHLKKAE